MPGPGMKLATEATLRIPPRCPVRPGPKAANTLASAAPMPAEAPVIRATGVGFGMTSGTGKLRDNLRRDRLGLDFFRIERIARSPDAGVEAFDAKFAVERDAVLHVEAR